MMHHVHLMQKFNDALYVAFVCFSDHVLFTFELCGCTYLVEIFWGKDKHFFQYWNKKEKKFCLSL